MSYTISSTERDGVVFSVDDLPEQARQRWGDILTDVSTVGAHDTLTLDLQPPGQPGYSIRVGPSGESMSTDGTAQQAAEVAVWARSLLPEDVPSAIWFYDDNGHTVLTPGMTEAEVWSNYKDGFE